MENNIEWKTNLFKTSFQASMVFLTYKTGMKIESIETEAYNNKNKKFIQNFLSEKTLLW